MNKICALCLAVLCILVSCEKRNPDGVLGLGYRIEFSDTIADEMLVQATKIPASDTLSIFLNRPYSSYKDVLIRFAPILSNNAAGNLSSNERINAVIHWYRSILDPLFPEHKNESEITAPYSTSCLDQAIEIIADVPMFGKEPGLDISEHFQVVTNPQYGSFQGHLLNSFDYEMGHLYDPWNGVRMPTEIKDYFYNGTILFCSLMPPYGLLHTAYCIVFKEYPQDAPNNLTLTINLPVKERLLSDAFGLDGSFDESKITERERVLTGSIHLVFSTD